MICFLMALQHFRVSSTSGRVGVEGDKISDCEVVESDFYDTKAEQGIIEFKLIQTWQEMKSIKS